MIKLLHFADAHIDIANYGAHDPQEQEALMELAKQALSFEARESEGWLTKVVKNVDFYFWYTDGGQPGAEFGGQPGPQPDQPGGNDEDVVEGEFHEA